jgi:uncharacterized SAM-binding protein YcdF (DUF218 family)
MGVLANSILRNPALSSHSYPELTLVTSASHMPRAMALFTKAGMNPVPAPTHYLLHANQGVSPTDFYPSLRRLRQSETVIYEGISILWAKLRGKA